MCVVSVKELTLRTSSMAMEKNGFSAGVDSGFMRIVYPILWT